MSFSLHLDTVESILEQIEREKRAAAEDTAEEKKEAPEKDEGEKKEETPAAEGSSEGSTSDKPSEIIDELDQLIDQLEQAIKEEEAAEGENIDGIPVKEGPTAEEIAKSAGMDTDELAILALSNIVKAAVAAADAVAESLSAGNPPASEPAPEETPPEAPKGETVDLNEEDINAIAEQVANAIYDELKDVVKDEGPAEAEPAPTAEEVADKLAPEGKPEEAPEGEKEEALDEILKDEDGVAAVDAALQEANLTPETLEQQASEKTAAYKIASAVRNFRKNRKQSKKASSPDKQLVTLMKSYIESLL